MDIAYGVEVFRLAQCSRIRMRFPLSLYWLDHMEVLIDWLSVEYLRCLTVVLFLAHCILALSACTWSVSTSFHSTYNCMLAFSHAYLLFCSLEVSAMPFLVFWRGSTLLASSRLVLHFCCSFDYFDRLRHWFIWHLCFCCILVCRPISMSLLCWDWPSLLCRVLAVLIPHSRGGFLWFSGLAAMSFSCRQRCLACSPLLYVLAAGGILHWRKSWLGVSPGGE